MRRRRTFHNYFIRIKISIIQNPLLIAQTKNLDNLSLNGTPRVSATNFLP